MGNAMWVIISAILALAAVLLGVLLWREQRDKHDVSEERDALARERDSAVAAKDKAVAAISRAQREPPEPAERTDAGDEDKGRKYVRAAQEAVNGTVRRMQSLGNDAAERIQAVLHTYGSDVLADLMPIDHVVAQMQRRLQVLAVLCGSWPGQQRSPAELPDIVRGAQSRIHDYARVRVSAQDERTAVVGRIVEPVGMALAELLDNATRSSPPTTPVDVVFETDYHGVSIMVIDGGVGMAPEELRRAVSLLQWGQHEVDLTELGNPPRTGFAVCGVLAARYGFRVGLDTGSPRGGLRATLFVPSALLTTIDPTGDARSLEPAVTAPEPVRVPEPTRKQARERRYDVGSYGTAGQPTTSFDTGTRATGFDTGGFDTGGFDTTGFDAGGYEPASYDLAGYDLGGYDLTAYDWADEDATDRRNSGDKRAKRVPGDSIRREAARQKAADARAADDKIAEEKAAEEKVAREKAADAKAAGDPVTGSTSTADERAAGGDSGAHTDGGGTASGRHADRDADAERHPEPRRASARDTIRATDTDAQPAMASTPSWPVDEPVHESAHGQPAEETAATTTSGLPKRRRASRVGRTGHTGELPALDHLPSPAPRHAQATALAGSAHVTEASASNLRSLQDGARRLGESEGSDDE